MTPTEAAVKTIVDGFAELAEARKRIAALEVVLMEWRAWYREAKPYRTRMQLEQMTDEVLENKETP